MDTQSRGLALFVTFFIALSLLPDTAPAVIAHQMGFAPLSPIRPLARVTG